jgi:uncharacterized protein DUF6524
MKQITGIGIGIRFVFAFLLVACTYNPSGYSYFHWFKAAVSDFTPLLGLGGIALIIGWVIYIRATFRSLGFIGLILATLFFGFLIWLLIDLGVLSMDSVSALTWVVLILLSAVLCIGMSWSHIRRRMAGQVDTDDVGDD